MVYYPDKQTFDRDTDQGKLVPVFQELPADLETPISVFLKLRKGSLCFLLESMERGERLGRYSFIGINPYSVLRTYGNEATINHNGDVSHIPLGEGAGELDSLHLVKKLLGEPRVSNTPGLPRFFGGAVGYVSYDTVRFFEKKLVECPQDDLHLPDAVFLFTDTLIIFDHLQHKMKVVAHALPGVRTSYSEVTDKIDALTTLLRHPFYTGTRSDRPARRKEPPPLVSNFTQNQFTDMVKAAKEYVLAGDILQTVVSQRLHRQTWADSFTIYRALRMLNPSPYMFYLDFSDFQLIGSSPEMLVKLEEGIAETRPIAGTRPRGKDEEDDKRLHDDLLADPKERAEHVMLVDLGRNDLGRVCHYGTVKVPLFMSIEKYSHVMHIVSSVDGQIRDDYDAFSLLRASFPAGTVSGAPKIRAMDIITELEGTRRGPYAGAVGYFSFTGNMDTCIAIRTIVMKGDSVYLQGGAGIVADSDPLREYQETLNKIAVLDAAVGMAENWET